VRRALGETRGNAACAGCARDAGAGRRAADAGRADVGRGAAGHRERRARDAQAAGADDGREARQVRRG